MRTCCKLLEGRLDNVVYRMGFGSTRAESRQLVSHKAVAVNGRIVNIASYQVKPTTSLRSAKNRVVSCAFNLHCSWLRNGHRLSG